MIDRVGAYPIASLSLLTMNAYLASGLVPMAEPRRVSKFPIAKAAIGGPMAAMLAVCMFLFIPDS
jgi:hypothetical protein